MNNYPDFSGKNRLIFVDGVDRNFAINNGLLYPNAIFFTTDNEIFKGGVGIANYITIDPNYNKFNGPNSVTYRLHILDGKLGVISGNVWLWYIGIGDFKSTTEPTMTSNWREFPNGGSGWFLITADSKITEVSNDSLDDVIKNTWIAGRTYSLNDEQPIIPTDKKNSWVQNSNPLYSYDFEYRDENGNKKDVHKIVLSNSNINGNININNYLYEINNNDGSRLFKIDLLLPCTIIDNFEIGLYDDFEKINYFDEARKYMSSQFETMVEENPNDVKPGIYYTLNDDKVVYSDTGINYYWYKIFVVTNLPASELLNKSMTFDMHLYKKYKSTNN